MTERVTSVSSIGSRTVGRPSDLLRVAFDGSEQGEDETPQQQQLQVWLFSRCKRLPGNLRQECSKRLAKTAAAIQHGAAAGTLLAEAVVAAGLAKRTTYMPDGGLSPAEDLAQAKQAAQADETLQLLLQQPVVAAAMQEIAKDPQAIERYSQQPQVMEAIQRLNSKLSA